LDDIVTIELFGEIYKFKVDSRVAEAADACENLTREVARIESEISGNRSGLSPFKILLLATLNISSDLLESRRNYSKLVEDLSERSGRLAEKIDGALR
jgi:cell division protein ZapA (FtsZ GTPase activity inhibitor)